jgi:hypothetical protein
VTPASLLLLAPALLAAPPDPWAQAEAADAEATPFFARDAQGLGVGLILGSLTGITGALRPDAPGTARSVTYDAAVAWSFPRGSVSTHADVRIDVADAGTEDFPDMYFPVYVGIGARVRLGDTLSDGQDADFDLGVRVPIGVSILHERTPVEGFVEVVPGIGLYPETSFQLDGAVGLRVYVPQGR